MKIVKTGCFEEMFSFWRVNIVTDAVPETVSSFKLKHNFLTKFDISSLEYRFQFYFISPKNKIFTVRKAFVSNIH